MVTIPQIKKALQIESTFIRNKKKNWLSPEEQKQLRKKIGFTLTNNMRSRYEVARIKKTKPTKLTLYMNEKNNTITTWTGQKISKAITGKTYKDNLGGVRIPVNTKIFGNNYYGTYYKSAGDYVRLKKAKRRK